MFPRRALGQAWLATSLANRTRHQALPTPGSSMAASTGGNLIPHRRGRVIARAWSTATSPWPPLGGSGSGVLLRCAPTRGLSTDDSGDGTSGAFASEAAFHEVADETLENVFEALGEAEDEGCAMEVSISQGVLNVVTEEHGSWVLNKQAPNQQIWWSSPLSGPMRFEFVASRGAWVGTRADVELIGLLHDEFSETMGVDIRSKLEDN
mmetsp:Transcript_5083/g.11267  ORF Transcript_5083/g.11267 Transcript_5083/m.11267 type:complete len:208 (+) Transcript_5083:85-708(+)